MENYVYIYFKKLPESCACDEIEETLEDLLENKGEVTGAGLGIYGGNIDIEFDEADVLEDIISYLLSCGFDGETILDINGKKRKLASFDK